MPPFSCLNGAATPAPSRLPRRLPTPATIRILSYGLPTCEHRSSVFDDFFFGDFQPVLVVTLHCLNSPVIIARPGTAHASAAHSSKHSTFPNEHRCTRNLHHSRDSASSLVAPGRLIYRAEYRQRQHPSYRLQSHETQDRLKKRLAQELSSTTIKIFSINTRVVLFGYKPSRSTIRSPLSPPSSHSQQKPKPWPSTPPPSSPPATSFSPAQPTTPAAVPVPSPTRGPRPTKRSVFPSPSPRASSSASPSC